MNNSLNSRLQASNILAGIYVSNTVERMASYVFFHVKSIGS